MRTIDVSYKDVYPPGAAEHFKEHHSPQEILSDWEQGYTIVLECDGCIVATGTLVDGKVTRVYVDPERQRCGLGKRVMRNLEQHALAIACERVFLNASIPTREFYGSLGYKLETEKAAAMEDGEKLVYFDMVKCLKKASE